MRLSFFVSLCLSLFLLPGCAEESLCTEMTWYRDVDGDGLGDPTDSVQACERPTGYVAEADPSEPAPDPYAATRSVFGARIDPEQPFDYAGQDVPEYIEFDNTRGNNIDNRTATLGRVLFYDTQLSFNNTLSCASCHQQADAFSDRARFSTGVAGETGRHSMRLVNARFGDEARFFWDERAESLEIQTTMPVQDHVEMGFSGQDGAPGMADLIDRLEEIDYYQELFPYAFGDAAVTEERMQIALAQFIRSIQSFDSKYDEGRSRVNNNNAAFPNFSAAENRGKQLFTAPPRFDGAQRIGGGLGCAGCHQGAEFSIGPFSRNNGITGAPDGIDLTVTRSPSLRDLVKPDGTSNGPFMHDGSLATLNDVLDHYNRIPVDPANDNLDPRLRPRNQPQRLNLTAEERSDLIAFLRTLSGTAVYSAEQWSDPFGAR